jgi:hypothetical protein
LSSQRLIAWLEQNLPSLERLASLEFVQSSHEQLFTEIGWQVVRESWYLDTCFEIEFADIQRRLVALYEAGQQEIGIGLYALTNPYEPHQYILESVAAYHDAFNRILRVMRQRLSQDPRVGTYHYADHEIDYHYATWDYQSVSLMLVQHHEGDGHLGHEASLDIRLRPQTPSSDFPLATNMLF